MSLRSTEQRKADLLEVLEQNRDVWLATASSAGRPHLIAVSAWWDGTSVVISTKGGSRTARNLEATGVARLGLGSPDNVALVEVKVAGSYPANDAGDTMAKAFAQAVGWNPAEEGPDWKFYRLMPVSAQAYRGYGELEGRDVMRGSRWLA
jgi:hypothetical protein